MDSINITGTKPTTSPDMTYWRKLAYLFIKNEVIRKKGQQYILSYHYFLELECVTFHNFILWCRTGL